MRVNFRKFHTAQCGKTRNCLTEKIFREINSLITNLFSKSFDFTKFLSKMCEREFAHCANKHMHYCKNFVKATVLLNKSVKSWFDEIFFQWDQIFHFSTLCTVWSSHQKLFSWNQLFKLYLVTSLLKVLLSRNFCQKNVRGNFRNFHTALWALFLCSDNISKVFW